MLYRVRHQAGAADESRRAHGVDGKGKSWEIMSIDIHTVENGKVVTSYHVEDWAGAIRQLKGD